MLAAERNNMQEIFNNLKFRAFSYEDDAEGVADMHCCAEVLEGSWFDRSETARMHSKVVVRSPGSSWVLAYGTVIFAHVDLVKAADNNGIVIAWRIHENYRFPQIVRLMLEGLSEQARKRECSGLLIFADNDKVAEEMSMIGMQPDREYSYADTSAVESGRILRHERVVLHTDDIIGMNLQPFLGSPLPPSYIVQRAFMGSDYGVFRHTKPDTFEIYHQDNTYLACHDGREWHVFRCGNFKGEKEIITSVLKTVASLKPGRIMLSDRALEVAELIPLNDGVYHDYYCAL
jgi:hypothetical protein